MLACGIDAETNGSHIKLSLQKEDTNNKKIEPKIDSVVHADRPLVTSNEATLKFGSQHTHTNTTNDHTVTGSLSLSIYIYIYKIAYIALRSKQLMIKSHKIKFVLFI